MLASKVAKLERQLKELNERVDSEVSRVGDIRIVEIGTPMDDTKWQRIDMPAGYTLVNGITKGLVKGEILEHQHKPTSATNFYGKAQPNKGYKVYKGSGANDPEIAETQDTMVGGDANRAAGYKVEFYLKIA